MQISFLQKLECSLRLFTARFNKIFDLTLKRLLTLFWNLLLIRSLISFLPHLTQFVLAILPVLEFSTSIFWRFREWGYISLSRSYARSKRQVLLNLETSCKNENKSFALRVQNRKPSSIVWIFHQHLKNEGLICASFSKPYLDPSARRIRRRMQSHMQRVRYSPIFPISIDPMTENGVKPWLDTVRRLTTL